MGFLCSVLFCFVFPLCTKVKIFLAYPLNTLKYNRKFYKYKRGETFILLETDIYKSYLKINLNVLLSLNKRFQKKKKEKKQFNVNGQGRFFSF